MRALATCLLIAGAATRLAAQAAPAASPARAVRDTMRWHYTRVIQPDVGGQLGAGLILGLGMEAPGRGGPSALSGAIGADLRFGTTGSRAGALVFHAPALWRDWRILALVRSERMLRTPYFGPKNAIEADQATQDQYGVLYYRYALLRTTTFATVQRRIAGPLWLYLGGQFRHYRTSSLRESPTLYAQDIAAGGGPDTLRWRGREGRAGLLFDTRSDWVAPRRGLLLEAVMAAGHLTYLSTDSSGNYRRWIFGAREFATLDDSARTVLALRQRLSMAGDTLPWFLAYEQVTSWAPDDGVHGSHFIRLHGGGNQLASNTAIVSVELRRKLMDSTEEPKQEKGLWGFVFGDGGVLWEPHTSASTGRTSWAIGAGMRLQTGRRSIVGFDLGYGDYGVGGTITSSFGF